MKKILVLLFVLAASPVWASCQSDFMLTPPKLHVAENCTRKADGAVHFSVFDATRQEQSSRKQGVLTRVQFRYTGDWTITPTRIQLVPFYLDQIRKYGGKLVFEDETKATYRYFANEKTHWVELSFVGDGIHMFKQVSQDGIQLDAAYNVPQMKSRMKRYGRIAFYELPQNTASMANIASFLNSDTRKFYIVSHVYGQGENVNISEQQAKAVYNRLIEAGVATDKIMAKGIGDVSPLKNPAGVNSARKNTRIELVLRH